MPSGPITTSRRGVRDEPRPRRRPSSPGRPSWRRARPSSPGGLGRAVGRPSAWPAAFLAGVLAVAVFFVVVAAATRAPLTSKWTEMPRRAQVLEEPLEVPWLDLGVLARPAYVLGTEAPPWPPASTSATTAGWVSTCSGTLRAFEKTRTPLQSVTGGTAGTGRGSGSGRGTTRCRQEPRCSFCHARKGVPASASSLDERVARSPAALRDRRRTSSTRPARAGAEREVPVLVGLAVDVEHPLVALAGLQRQRADLEGEREVDVGTVHQPGRAADLGLAGDLDRLRPLRARDGDRLAVLADRAAAAGAAAGWRGPRARRA